MAIELSDWVVALRLAQRRVADEIQAANTHLNRASRLMDIETKGGGGDERERGNRDWRESSGQQLMFSCSSRWADWWQITGQINRNERTVYTRLDGFGSSSRVCYDASHQ